MKLVLKFKTFIPFLYIGFSFLLKTPFIDWSDKRNKKKSKSHINILFPLVFDGIGIEAFQITIAAMNAPKPQPLTTVKPDPTQRRRKSTSMDTQTIYEIVDLENDNNDPENDIIFISESKRRVSNERVATKADAISVESHGEDRDLQAAIMASLSAAIPDFFDLDVYDGDDDEIRIVWSKTPKRKPFFSGPSVTEIGESSNSMPLPPPPREFECAICADTKPCGESFAVIGCDHSYCADCMARYVASKLDDNVTAVTCPSPGCGGWLEAEQCREILPREVYERWGAALCEEAIVRGGGKVFYCPYKDCSAVMEDDGGAVVVEANCWSCNRMFCAQCKVGWHSGVTCEEFLRLGKDERESEDLMLMRLAHSKHWKRCPNCMFFVDKSEGCLYMKCRCGTAFCYHCGNVYTEHTTHFCKKCKR